MSIWMILTLFFSRLILLTLFGLSVWSVSIMIDRRRYFKKVREQESYSDLKRLVLENSIQQRSKELHDDRLLSGLVLKALETKNPNVLERKIKSHILDKKIEMEKNLTVLATLGSNAPFIGLLGTVLGIIQAFGELGRQGTGSQSVMSGISEALVATAVGLIVAIPAVLAYNYFNRLIRVHLAECDSLRDLLIANLESK